MEEIKKQIEKWLLPELDKNELFLVEIKTSAGGKKLDVYIDSDTGVTINQCAEISRFLEQYLDGNQIVPENYTLEVSSPGMTNPLRVPRQFKRRLGKVLEVWLNDGSFVTVILDEVTDIDVKVTEVLSTAKKKKGEKTLEPRTFRLLYTDIKKALIQIKF